MTKEQRTNMADNIDAMDSLMTIFDCELYVLEHLIMCLGDCYYLDLQTQTIHEAYSTLTADEQGDVEFTVYPITDKSISAKTSIKLEANLAYRTVSKDEDELKAMMGK